MPEDQIKLTETERKIYCPICGDWLYYMKEIETYFCPELTISHAPSGHFFTKAFVEKADINNEAKQFNAALRNL